MLFTERQSGSDHGIIIKLELAPSLELVQKLTGSYDEPHIRWLRLNTELDFFYIISYTALFFFAFEGLLERFSTTGKLKLLVFLAAIPGIFDVVENLFLLNFLNHDFRTPYFSIYYFSVHIKWALVCSFSFLALVQLGLILRDKFLAK